MVLLSNPLETKPLNTLAVNERTGILPWELHKLFGWTIKSMGRTKDDVIDLMATQILLPSVKFEMMVQCKRYSPERKVGLSVVKEVWATKWKHGFHQAMIATTSVFTKGAKEQAQEWDLELRDQKEIIDWCSNVGKVD